MKVPHAIALVFFVVAFALYLIAGTGGAAVFFGLGMLTELVAWLAFFVGERPRDDDQSRPPG